MAWLGGGGRAGWSHPKEAENKERKFQNVRNMRIIYCTKLYFLRNSFLLYCRAEVGNLRPAKAFYPARDFLLSCGPRPFFFFFSDRYAAINCRNDSRFLAKTYFCSLRHRFVFFFGLRHQFGQKKPEFLAKTFLFWSAGMVAARWNFIRTECGPLVQKDADPCCRASVDIKATKFEMECRTQ